jgi:hypothetical protein
MQYVQMQMQNGERSGVTGLLIKVIANLMFLPCQLAHGHVCILQHACLRPLVRPDYSVLLDEEGGGN